MIFINFPDFLYKLSKQAMKFAQKVFPAKLGLEIQSWQTQKKQTKEQEPFSQQTCLHVSTTFSEFTSHTIRPSCLPSCKRRDRGQKANPPRFSRHCWIFPTSPTSTWGTCLSTSQSNCKPRSCALACSIRKVLDTIFSVLKGTLSTSRRPDSIFARSNTLLMICNSRSAHSFTDIKLSFCSSESSDSNSNAVNPRIPWIGVLHMIQ